MKWERIMKKGTKTITTLALIAGTILPVAITFASGLTPIFAEGNVSNVEFIPNLANKLASEPNKTPEIITFEGSNGIQFKFEVYLCHKNSNSVVIEKGGYIRNLTAINGLANIKNFACSDSSLASFVECEADETEESISPINAFKGDSSCKSHAFNGTNFILKSDGVLTVSSLEVNYSCVNGAAGNIYSDALGNEYEFTNECDYYDYGADGASASTPYKVNSEEGLLALANEVNDGNSMSGKYFKLNSDLDFSGENAPDFVSIGNADNPFDGHFDASNGQGRHTITVNEVFMENAGAFGGISSNAVIEGLNVEGIIAYEDDALNIGGIAGVADGGIIRNCSVGAYIQPVDLDTTVGGSSIGGIVGSIVADTQILSCDVTSEMYVQAGVDIGGLVGICDETCFLKDCNFNGTLFVNADDPYLCDVGGIIGFYDGVYPSTRIVNCSVNVDDDTEWYNRFLISTPYDGMQVGHWMDYDSDGYQAYIGTEIGYSNNSDYAEFILEPGCWDVDHAWYAIYAYDDKGGSDWYIMEKDLFNDFYITRFDVDSYVAFIFVRMSDQYDEPTWDGKWNQTNDIFYDGSSNYYKITGWNKGDVSKSSFDRF